MKLFKCLRNIIFNKEVEFKCGTVYASEKGIIYGEHYSHEIKKFNIDFNSYFKDVTKEGKISHPSHYTWLKDKCGIEVIDITRHMDFDLGNAIKYILRAGYKSEEGYSTKEKTIEDLKKAVWYINDKIEQLNKHE